MEKLIQEETNKYAKAFYKNLLQDDYYLVEEERYSGAKKPVKVNCSKGHEYNTSPDNFNQGKRCITCSRKKHAEEQSHTHEDFVKQVYSEEGTNYSVLGEYERASIPIKMEHNECGTIYNVKPNNFNSGRRCPVCYNSNRSAHLKHSKFDLIDAIKEQVGDEYTFEGKFVDYHTPIKMRHNNVSCENHTWMANPSNFLHSGKRCPKCAIKHGSEHHSYDPSIPQEERERGRRMYQAELKRWRLQVLKKDKFTCQQCGDKESELHAHHLNGYHWDRENRFNVENGGVLCKTCHLNFHKDYGNRDNTKEQYEHYISSKLQPS